MDTSLAARGRRFASDAARRSKDKRRQQVTFRDLGWERLSEPDTDAEAVDAPAVQNQQLQVFNDRMRDFALATIDDTEAAVPQPDLPMACGVKRRNATERDKRDRHKRPAALCSNTSVDSAPLVHRHDLGHKAVTLQELLPPPHQPNTPLQNPGSTSAL